MGFMFSAAQPSQAGNSEADFAVTINYCGG